MTECETLYIPFNHDSEDSQDHREDSTLHCMCCVVSSLPIVLLYWSPRHVMIPCEKDKKETFANKMTGNWR